MLSLSRWSIVLIVLILLTACNTPTPIALLPSPEPTAMPVPPTATSTVAPTATPQPPTSTSTSTPTAMSSPTLTATPVPTQAATATKAPTQSATAARATATQAPASANGVPIAGAVPAGAPLNVAVNRTFDNAQRLQGELNNVLAGRGGSCDTAIGKYNAIASAPTYAVADQSTDVQTAYGLYRQAIDTINATAAKVRRVCDAGGGPIGRLDLQEALRSVAQAVALLGRAVDLLPPAPASGPEPSATPKPTAAVSSMALSDLLLKTMERLQIVGGLLDGAQTNLNGGFCDQFTPQYRTIIAVVTLNESGRAPTWIDSYGAYKAAIQYFQNKLYRAREVCDAGGSAIGKAEFNDMRGAVNAAINALAHAYDQLRTKNLLGQ